MFKKVSESIAGILEVCTSQNITLTQGLVSMGIIVLLRVVIEVFSSPFYTGQMQPLLTIFSYSSFFAVVFLSCFVVLSYFSRLSFKQIFSLQVICFSGILLPPILDLVFNGGHMLTYTGETGVSLIKSFFTIGSHALGTGFSWGLRIQILLLHIGFATLIYFFGKKQKSILYAIGVTVILYILLFIQGAFVGIIMSLVTSKTLSSGADAFLMMYNNLGQSFLKTHHGWVLSQIWTHQKIEESFALFMARLHIISSIVLLGILIRKYTKNIFQWLVEHVAWVKIFCYVALSCVGMYIARNLFLSEIFATYINITGLLMLILSFCFHGITATVVNDIADQELDNDAHPDRVLQTGKISLKDYKTIGLVSFCLAIITSVTINYTVTLYLVILQGLYFLHATPPFRLKQNWMSSILVYFFMGFTVLLIGYFFISPTQKISEIPLVLFSLISSIVGISSIAKDIHDYQGDKKHGLKTFPVQFGQMVALGTVIVGVSVGILGILIYLKLIVALYTGLIFICFIIIYSVNIILKYRQINYSISAQQLLYQWTKVSFWTMMIFLTVSILILAW